MLKASGGEEKYSAARKRERQSLLGVKSLLKAVFDLIITHRLLLRQPADRNASFRTLIDVIFAELGKCLDSPQ